MIFNDRRNRIYYFVLFVFVIFFGFFARVFEHLFPPFIGSYLPDTLWGLMVFFGIGMLLEKAKTRNVAIYSLIFAYSIECSQLLTHPTLVEIRSTTFGGLLLGHGFLWSDLVCYTIGILIGAWVEFFVQKQRKTR